LVLPVSFASISWEQAFPDLIMGAEDQERPSGRCMTAPQWWVIDNGCWTDSWLSAQV
jgi:hypothetical protein